MVGVAGKSKGCNSCRARRIKARILRQISQEHSIDLRKCDLGQPECDKCLRIGRHCPGYRRDAVFINYGGSSASASAAITGSAPSTIENTQGIPETGTAMARPARAPRTQPSREEQPSLQLVAQVNNHHAFRNQFAGEFLRIYLPSFPNCPKVPLTWLQLVFDVSAEGPALDSATTAVTLSVIGKSAGDSRLSMESARRYGQALQQLQKALWDERLMYKDETLAACDALLLYEVGIVPR